MSLPLVVLLCGVAAAVLAFAHVGVAPDTGRPSRSSGRAASRAPLAVAPSASSNDFLEERMDRRTAGGFLLTASLVVLFVVTLVVGWVLDMIDNNSRSRRGRQIGSGVGFDATPTRAPRTR